MFVVFNNFHKPETRLLNLYLYKVAFDRTGIYMSVTEYFKRKENFLILV